MNLSEQEFEVFSSVFTPLVIYINRKLQILPEINSKKRLLDLEIDKRFTLHAALYDNIKLVNDFITDNPDLLTEEQLKIAAQFKKFVRGDFFVERYLSKYSIFIDDKNKVYGVLGLTEPLADIIDKSYLPLSIHTTLLPFNGKIIYDGILKTRNIFFGSGIKSELKEIYLAAKQCNRIIENLEKPPTISRTGKSSSNKDCLAVIKELKKETAKLEISSDDSAVFKQTIAIFKNSLALVEIAANSPKNWGEINQAERKITTALKQLEKVIERAQRFN